MVLKIAVCEILCFIRNYFDRGEWFVEVEFVVYASESVPSSILGNCINRVFGVRDSDDMTCFRDSSAYHHWDEF